MNTKLVSQSEMQDLSELNSVREHPYFYKFTYSRPDKKFKAIRLLKRHLSDIPRLQFFQTDVSSNAIGKAINRIERIREKIGFAIP